MKNLLIASAAAAALFVAPAAASANGFVDLTYNNASDFDIDGVAVGGSVLAPVGALNLQFDANFTRNDLDGDTWTMGAGAVHLFTRNDSWAFGGFAAVQDPGFYTIGLEGAKYYDQVTLNGALSLTADDVDFGLSDVTTLNVGAKFFATDNFSVGANYARLDSDDFGDTDFWGLNAEFKTASPVSLTASYTNWNDADADVWSIGARWNFGAETLKERDRSGPSMQGGGAGFLLNIIG